MTGADSRSPIAILIELEDKRRSRCAGLRVAGCAVTIACAALVVAAQQIGTLTPNQSPQESSLATAQPWIRDGRFAQAEAVLRPLIAADPKGAEPRYLLAYSLMREDKPADSLKEYTSAASLRTPSAADLRNVALDYVLLKDLPEADRWMSRSLAMDGNDAETWSAMGRIHYTQGRYGDALTCFQKTLALNSRSVKGENNSGLAYEALNRRGGDAGAGEPALSLSTGTGVPARGRPRAREAGVCALGGAERLAFDIGPAMTSQDVPERRCVANLLQACGRYNENTHRAGE